MLPGIRREVAPLTRLAHTTANVLQNGLDRGEENLFTCAPGTPIVYEFDAPVSLRGVRLVFDSDLNRDYHNMPCSYPLQETRFFLPRTLVRDYTLIFSHPDGTENRLHVTDNHQRLCRHTLTEEVVRVTLVLETSWGSPDMRLFSFEVCGEVKA